MREVDVKSIRDPKPTVKGGFMNQLTSPRPVGASVTPKIGLPTLADSTVSRKAGAPRTRGKNLSDDCAGRGNRRPSMST